MTKHYFSSPVVSLTWSILVCAPNFNLLIQYEVKVIHSIVICCTVYISLKEYGYHKTLPIIMK